MDCTLEYLRPAMKRKETAPSANTVRFSCYGVRIAIQFDSHVPPLEIRSILPPESTEFECAGAEHCFSLLRSAGTDDESNPMYLVGSPRLISPPQSLGPALVALRKTVHLCIAEH